MDLHNPGPLWDERYEGVPAVYGFGPNAFFKSELARLPTGRLLLPGDGEGRNACYAAAQGWSVRSFDASEVGVRKSLQWAEDRGVEIAAEVGDCRTWKPQETFDVIGLFYLHLPADMRSGFHRRVAQWVKPGGRLILEGFGPGQLRFTSGGPKHRDMLFTAEMLEGDFSGLEILRCETREVELDEGPYHQGRAEVTRLLAFRPVDGVTNPDFGR